MRLNPQKTIKASVDVQGKSLFSGVLCRLTFKPAPPDSGMTFIRTDTPTPVSIPGDIKQVMKRARRTSIINGTVSVETVEHVLSAAWGMDLDNLIIEVNSEETPSTDGSPLPFVKALQEAGVQEQESPRAVFAIDEPLAVSEGDAMLAALPGCDDCLDILYDLDYSGTCIGRQVVGFRLGKDDYAAGLAPARTFLLEKEALEFQARGIGKHLTPQEMLVMGDAGPIGGNALRFADEHARHKVCDLIGDLALLGRRLTGRIVAYKSGHELNHALVRKLLEQMAHRHLAKSVGEPIMDIRSVMRLLPHRYPFLMVDRIVELVGDQRAVGIKNVTINEPFFQGHYPGQPIMPGVMILEALAQLSGILLSRRLEHTGKVAVLLSMDRVKMRRAVKPGDQLILQAEALHVRPRTGHCRCQAMVGAEIAAEAEIKFMLVDAEPI